MGQKRKRHRSTQETADELPNVNPTSPATALSSSDAITTPTKNNVAAFRAEDRPLLSFLALCATQSTSARSAESALDAVLTPPKGGKSKESLQPSSPTAKADAAENEGGGLADQYPEVRVLSHLHRLRCALRDLQGCPEHARREFYEIAEKHMTGLAMVLPDPLFLAIAAVLKSLINSSAEEAMSKPHCHVLEVQLMHVVEETQVELLRATKLLTDRCRVLTLRFHHDMPFL